MEGKRGIWLKKLTREIVSSISRDVFIFAFFLLLSFVFWYLNSLGKETEGELKFQLKYINLPKDRILVDIFPSKLYFYVKAPGYSILKLKISGNRRPVVIDLSKVIYKRVIDSNLLSYYIVSSNLIQTFTKQLYANLEITSIKPDSIFFSFSPIITKKVPVVPDVKVNIERQYNLKDPINCVPDSVKITGPKQVIDTTPLVKTKYQKFTGPDWPVTKTIKCSIVISDYKRI